MEWLSTWMKGASPPAMPSRMSTPYRPGARGIAPIGEFAGRKARQSPEVGRCRSERRFGLFDGLTHRRADVGPKPRHRQPRRIRSPTRARHPHRRRAGPDEVGTRADCIPAGKPGASPSAVARWRSSRLQRCPWRQKAKLGHGGGGDGRRLRPRRAGQGANRHGECQFTRRPQGDQACPWVSNMQAAMASSGVLAPRSRKSKAG